MAEPARNAVLKASVQALEPAAMMVVRALENTATFMPIRPETMDVTPPATKIGGEPALVDVELPARVRDEEQNHEAEGEEEVRADRVLGAEERVCALPDRVVDAHELRGVHAQGGHQGAWFPPPGAPSVREIRDTSLNWKIAKRMPMMPLTMMNAPVAAGEARGSRTWSRTGARLEPKRSNRAPCVPGEKCAAARSHRPLIINPIFPTNCAISQSDRRRRGGSLKNVNARREGVWVRDP